MKLKAIPFTGSDQLYAALKRLPAEVGGASVASTVRQILMTGALQHAELHLNMAAGHRKQADKTEDRFFYDLAVALWIKDLDAGRAYLAIARAAAGAENSAALDRVESKLHSMTEQK